MAEVLQTVGLVLVVVAFFLIWIPAGLFVAGLVLAGVGMALDPRVTGRDK